MRKNGGSRNPEGLHAQDLKDVYDDIRCDAVTEQIKDNDFGGQRVYNKLQMILVWQESWTAKMDRFWLG